MFASSRGDSRYRVFLLCIALVGVLFAVIATSRYGAGVSSDAARNLSTADSLLAGKGFVDMVGSPLVLWPPLYPILLAGLSLATGLPTFQVAWFLNVVLYGINIWLAGWWLFVVFRGKPFYAVVGSLIVLFSRSLLRIHANVASEPFFEALVFAFLLSSAEYLRTGRRPALWTMCAAAGLAALQRYLGVVFLGVALIVLYRRAGTRALLQGAMAWLLAAAPIMLWVVLHNYPISGSPFGPRELGAMLPIQNFGLSLTKILWWFVPRWGPLDWLLLRPWMLLSVIAVVLILLNTPHHWKAWLHQIASEAIWPGLLFAVAYSILLAFTVVTADHLDLTSDRYYVILLPIVVALALSVLDALVLSHLGQLTNRSHWVLTAALILWAVYPVYGVQSYLRDYDREGLEAFQRHEALNADVPLEAGPFLGFLKALCALQRRFPADACPLRTALITARDAISHQRVVRTLRAMEVRLDEVFFLGGVPKERIVRAFRPHIFFDDSLDHVGPASRVSPSAQVPRPPPSASARGEQPPAPPGT